MVARKQKAPPQPKQAPKTRAPRIVKANPLGPPAIRRRAPPGEGPPRPLLPEDTPFPPEDDEEEEEAPPGTASLAQFQRLEASIDERFEQLDAAFQSSYHDLGAMMDDKFGQLLRHLNPQQPGYTRPSQFGDNRPLGLGYSGITPPPSGDDVLSRWFWLDKSTVEAIDLGNFDINQLPKLQREESARTRYLAKAPDGFRMSLDGSKVELITTRTKLQSVFPTLQRFLSAWQIYISVRTQYHPEYSPGLAFWTERLIYRASIHPWDSVLNYAIAYFQAHQRDPPAYWFRPDSDLITDTIGSTPSRPTAVLNTPLRYTTSPSKATGGYGSNICQNWNRSKCTVKETTGYDCIRRHVCNTCSKEDHRAPQCPQRPGVKAST
jgi:hypothetical protein